MPEGVDHTSIWHPWLQPFVQRHTTEFALHLASLQYLGKARVELVSRILCAAQSDAPTSGTCLLLDDVFSLRQGCSTRLM